MTAALASSSVRPGPARVWAVLAWLLAGLVLVQAALAGQSLFQGSDIAVHGYIGNASFTVTFLGAVLVVAARLPKAPFTLSVALLALTFAQTGLGYVGRDSAVAASWHIPLGVAIFGLACVQAAAGVPYLRASSSSADARRAGA